MGNKIDFSQIENLLISTPNFSLTEKQYKKLIGRDLPKDHSYLVHRSALADFLKKLGYRICIQERTIHFEKTK